MLVDSHINETCVLPAGQVTVIINFLCNVQGDFHNVEPRYTGFIGDVHLFDVMTSLACAPSVVVDCVVYGPNGQKYDLTPLIRRKDNWVMSSTSNRKDKFYVNVCHSVNPMNGSRCSG
jgi:hypothetical protein